jgi:hypothetical protein
MDRLSELHSNPFLQHFRQVLCTLDPSSGRLNDTKSAADDWFAFRLKAFEMIDAFPYYVVEKIHPERIIRSLETYRDRYDFDPPDGFFQTLRAASQHVSKWNDCLSDITDLISSQPVLTKRISNLPVMTDWFRFPDADWIYLPFLNWNSFDQLDDAFTHYLPGFSPAAFYRTQWLQLPEITRKKCRIWIRHKMHPEKYPVFERCLLKKSSNMNRHMIQNAENVLKTVMHTGG